MDGDSETAGGRAMCVCEGTRTWGRAQLGDDKQADPHQGGRHKQQPRHHTHGQRAGRAPFPDLGKI
jgi:hypothetical protein